MKVLLVGSGGREHAIAWKLAQSPLLKKLYIAPGNPGTAELGENVPISTDDHAGICRFARERGIDLVLVGPEAPLAAGLADVLQENGIRVFGPSKKAAQIEASKVFAKQFMEGHHIPSPQYALFDNFEHAAEYLETLDSHFVIKASGLAAGKGVVLPDTIEDARASLHAMLVTREFGDAGSFVVIEERLSGPEVSLLAFSDGTTVRAMLPAQDHKRLLDGDRGPNTGGMGAYAPAPVCPPEMVEEITRTILQPTIDGMRELGSPFIGVLYAGLMLTPDGPAVLEYNCRFGDPETQALLPLLKSDLLEIAFACVKSRLHTLQLEWEPGSAACVVLASRGYPGKPEVGQPISGLGDLPDGTVCFQAGTKAGGSGLVTAGGRVLAVTGMDDTLQGALDSAYAGVERVHFEGKQYRRDIGRRAVEKKSAYADAGVDIDAGNRAVRLMSDAVRSTYTPDVLAGIGAFGGLFAADGLKEFHSPVLVASTDGVGTKVKLAAELGRYRGVGMDIVNHCINDILVQGARPLFFLDYFATSALKPEITAEIVSGIAVACKEAGCVLLGGETAEMPGVYAQGEFDVAGTIVGVVERERILPRKDLQAGDVLVGLRSTGPHTNGYSLIRRIFTGVDMLARVPELGASLGEALLASHRSYLPLLAPVLQKRPGRIKALAHLTGGGLIENIPRVLPEVLSAAVQMGSWPVPPLFRMIQERGQLPDIEMLRVFNMGIGMAVIVSKSEVEQFQADLGEPSWVFGELEPGEKKVVLR